jgi:hypothetical protein
MTSDRGRTSLERLRKIKPFIQASLSLTKKGVAILNADVLKKVPFMRWLY